MCRYEIHIVNPEMFPVARATQFSFRCVIRRKPRCLCYCVSRCKAQHLYRLAILSQESAQAYAGAPDTRYFSTRTSLDIFSDFLFQSPQRSANFLVAQDFPTLTINPHQTLTRVSRITGAFFFFFLAIFRFSSFMKLVNGKVS